MRNVPRTRVQTPVCLFALALATLLTAAPASAQMLDDYPSFDLDDLDERYRVWAQEEVFHIMTKDEYEVFIRLDSNTKRDRFIERFWQVRDVTPGTPRNEYHELHYERVAYADKFYGRGTSRRGVLTDMGKIHVLLGEPRMRSRLPSDMLTYPTEVWFYSADPELGLPPFFYMVFLQRFGSGEYRLYSPLSDGPDKLLNGAGQQEVINRLNETSQRGLSPGYAPTGFGDVEAIYSILREVDVDLAAAAFSLFPSEAGLEYGVTPLRSEMLLGQVFAVPELLMPNATWAINVLTGVTESEVRFETIIMDATATGLIDTDGEPFIHFATSALGEHLSLSEYDGDYYFAFDASGSVSTPDLKVLQTFDANLSGDLDTEQARRFTRHPFIYMDILPSLPGPQTFSVMLENKIAHTFGQAEIDLDVPQAHPEEVALAGPVLALDVRQVPDFDPFGARYAFQYANVAMVPSVTGEFYLGQPVLVFQQILLPEGHSAPVTGRMELRDITGTVVRDAQEEFTAADADIHGVLPYVWQIATEGLSAGRYRLTLSVDGVSGSRSREVTLRVPDPEAGRPFINAQPAAPASDVGVALERARQYRVAGDLEEAARWLRDALARDPDNRELRAEHMDLLRAAGLWEELIELLTPLVADDPRDAETMLELARAHTQAGEHYDAIRYYERSRIVLKKDTPELLNALASEYYSEGRADKAQEILLRSLELNAEQPEVRKMLEQISEPVAEPQPERAPWPAAR